MKMRLAHCALLLVGIVCIGTWGSQAVAAQIKSDIPLGASTIVIGAAVYPDQLATSNIAAIMLQRLGYKTKIVTASPGVWFAGIATGSIDIGLNAWLPVTYGPYFNRYKSKLQKLGIVYGPTSLGWAVPDYIPKSELNSIAQLKNEKVKDKLKGTIVGVGAGAGIMKLSDKMMKDYGLAKYGYTLEATSGPIMVAALKSAIQRHQWVVVTSWRPHYMWARWKLRYLQEPKDILKGGDQVYAVSTLDFNKKFPRATAFIKNFKLPLSDVGSILLAAEKLGSKKGVFHTVAEKYIAEHPELVRKWLAGVTNASN